MGANYHQRYHFAEAFAKGIGVVPSNEVSGGKLIKQKASHGNRRVKFHLLSASKVFAIHGKGRLRTWFDAYRGRAKYRKAVSALARRVAEGLWWVMERQEPYKYWQGEQPPVETEAVEVGRHLVNPATGEVLDVIDPFEST
jgi:hypothetical protein